MIYYDTENQAYLTSPWIVNTPWRARPLPNVPPNPTGFVAVSYVHEDGAVHALAIQTAQRGPRLLRTGIKQLLARVTRRRYRLYYDALQARHIEMCNDLPAPDQYREIRTAARLLGAASSAGLIDWAQSTFGPQVAQLPPLPAPPAELGAITPAEWHALREVQMLAWLYRYNLVADLLRCRGLTRIWQVEHRVLEPTAHMLVHGVRVDVEGLRNHEQGLRHLQEVLRQQALAYNPPVRHFTGEEKSVWAEVSQTRQLLSTADPETGRVHSHLDPLGTVNGRFTTRKPSLHSLAVNLRQFVCADPGRRIVQVRFPDLELHVVAELSGDERLSRACARGDDLHRHLAAQLFLADADAVSDEQLQLADTVKRCMLYGYSTEKLAKNLGDAAPDAELLVRRFWRLRDGLRAWLRQLRVTAAEKQAAFTHFGRRRGLPDLASESGADYEVEFRKATAMVIKGTAADVLKLALFRIWCGFPADCRIVLALHDSLLFEVPQESVSAFVSRLQRVLEHPMPGLKMPLRTLIGVGQTWSEVTHAQCVQPRRVRRPRGHNAPASRFSPRPLPSPV